MNTTAQIATQNTKTHNAGRSLPHPSEAPLKAGGKRRGNSKKADPSQALMNAVSHESTMNYEAIFLGFMEKGIGAEEIIPRQNVFTFHAWRALGRTVRRGEHGVKVVTWVPYKKTNKDTGEDEECSRPVTTTVFHISQTDELNAK